MVTKKKKIIVLSVMMGLLVLTGFLNVTLNQAGDDVINTSGNTITSANFFTTYRTDRDAARSQEELYYKAILESASSTESAKESAQTALNNLAAIVESELQIESGIKARGFEDAVVSMTDNFVNVMVKGELTEDQVTQIYEIVNAQTGKSIDNVKVIPIE